MNSIGLRALAAYRVLTGVAILALVGLLVFEAGKYRFTWGVFGGVIFLSLKGWFALMIGYRFLRQTTSTRIGPGEWCILGVGYCIIASAFLVAAISGEGWVYGLFAAFVATMAPVWFVLCRRARRDVTPQQH